MLHRHHFILFSPLWKYSYCPQFKNKKLRLREVLAAQSCTTVGRGAGLQTPACSTPKPSFSTSITTVMPCPFRRDPEHCHIWPGSGPKSPISSGHFWWDKEQHTQKDAGLEAESELWDTEATVTGEWRVATLLGSPMMGCAWGAEKVDPANHHYLSGMCRGLSDPHYPAPQLLSGGTALVLFREPPASSGCGCPETLHSLGESCGGMDGTRGQNCWNSFYILLFHFTSFYYLFSLMFYHILLFAASLWEELWQWQHLSGWPQYHLQFKEVSVLSSLLPPSLH